MENSVLSEHTFHGKKAKRLQRKEEGNTYSIFYFFMREIYRWEFLLAEAEAPGGPMR